MAANSLVLVGWPCRDEPLRGCRVSFKRGEDSCVHAPVASLPTAFMVERACLAMDSKGVEPTPRAPRWARDAHGMVAQRCPEARPCVKTLQGHVFRRAVADSPPAPPRCDPRARASQTGTLLGRRQEHRMVASLHGSNAPDQTCVLSLSTRAFACPSRFVSCFGYVWRPALDKLY